MIIGIAPAVVRLSVSVESRIDQVDGYGLLRQQVVAKREQLASEFAYLTVAIRRFYLAKGQWGGWLLSVAARRCYST